jgi:hypothetical protein
MVPFALSPKLPEDICAGRKRSIVQRLFFDIAKQILASLFFGQREAQARHLPRRLPLIVSSP